MSRVFRLTLLAPEIVELILEGRQPGKLYLRYLRPCRLDRSVALN